MARKNAQPVEKTVNEELLVQAFANVVSAGDIVDFRFLFSAFSPARKESTERFESEKYAYLLPNGESESSRLFKEAMSAVRRIETLAHIRKELQEKRPPKYPCELVLLLADNAVRLGKFTSAAQAYELLRIRRRMQQIYFDEADAALDRGDTPTAVRGYRTAVGLAYDYAAFPEPLPSKPNYQTEALKLHGVYPLRPEDCVAVLDPENHLHVALEYLLTDTEAAGRLRERPVNARLDFLKELVSQIDPGWEAFVKRYREACALGMRLQNEAASHSRVPASLEEEIAEQNRENPAAIPALLLGRPLRDGQWWQYLKELAYKHPAAALFIARQAVGDQEILIPRYRSGSAVPKALWLVDDASALDAPLPAH